MFAEVIRYADEHKQKELCLTLFKKDHSDLIGALLSENDAAINSVCALLRAIVFVGPAAAQLLNQYVPLATIRKLPEMITTKKTRNRVARWIIREDPDVTGKQILLRPDIVSALAEGIHQDGTFLMRDVLLRLSPDA